MMLFLVIACNNDDADFMIQLNESFIAKKGKKYTCITDNGDEIIIDIEDINDNRYYGTDCSRVLTGGVAEVETEITIKETEYSNTFSFSGCDGYAENIPTNPNLPEIEIEGGYTLKMMKLYPISESQEKAPSSERDYGIRLILLK